MNEYVELSHRALAEAHERDGRPVDLVIWPETMFRSSLRMFDPGFQLPPAIPQTTEEITAAGPRDLANLVAQLGTPVLVGIDRVHFLADESSASGTPNYRAYNSAVLVDRGGRIVGTYDKVHLVMFGEYVPFSGSLPFLKRISSITGSADPGAGPVALCLDGICYAPNICYETAIPHVIRNQVSTLQQRGRESFFRSDGSRPPSTNEKRLPSPFVLVNLTNDAWYWGSSELDMHLACDVFRAVETRRPLVVAANGGISAWIDRFGRIRAQSPRQKSDVILADVELNRDGAVSVYVRIGDAFAGVCLTCCIALTIIGWRGRRKPK
jgi:apolipoprotein N-acyltransferase